VTTTDSNDSAPAAVSPPDRAGFSQSLERGLAVLDAFAGVRATLGIADIAREVGLNKSTTHRYVNTLAVLGYLHQDPESRKYRLGARAVEIGFAALNSIEITRVAAQPLQRLADETGFTVSMAVLDGPAIVYVERRRTAQDRQLDLNLQVGSRLPAYCTALGKVLLAAEEPARLRSLLDRIDLARRAPNTITAREHLLAALDRIRRGGVAVNDEELMPGLRAIAVPVRDRSRRVVAAINVAVHTAGWNASADALLRRLELPLRRTAADISRQLGYHDPAA
jgi:IclR family transcriptional regulator, pca regulon regulatory protein